MIHTVKGFGVVNKAEVDVFLELSCFFDDPVDVGNLISGSSVFSRNPASTSGSLRFTYCWSLTWRILNITLLVCEMSEITSQPGWNLIFWPDKIIQNICRNSSYLLVCVCVCVCVRARATPWTVAHQAPLSMGFSRQEYWSGLPLPPPRDFPNPGIGPVSPTSTGSFFIAEPLGNTYWPLTLKFLLILGYISYRYLTA